jgi:methionyl-tRNA formyltransferase
MIWVIGNRWNTQRLVIDLINKNYDVSLISLSESVLKKHDVQGGFTKKNRLNNLSAIVNVPKSSITSSDLTNISVKPEDILIVYGWQAMIHQTVIDLFNNRVLGFHGSPEGPPFGRGHSALLWSIIEGYENFTAYMFGITKYADNGPIITTHKFSITVDETSASIGFKYYLSIRKMLFDYLPTLKASRDALNKEVQDDYGCTYYPKRSPEDGVVNWNNKASDVYRLIKAISAPYPLARAIKDERVFKICDTQFFGKGFRHSQKPGVILEILPDDRLLVQTRDYPVIVKLEDEHEFIVGDSFD